MRTINTKNLARLTNAAVVEFLQQVTGASEKIGSESILNPLIKAFKDAAEEYKAAYSLEKTTPYTAEVNKCAYLAMKNWTVLRDVVLGNQKSSVKEKAEVAQAFAAVINQYNFKAYQSFHVRFGNLQTILDSIDKLGVDKLSVLGVKAEYLLIKEARAALDEAVKKRNEYRNFRKAKVRQARIVVMKTYHAIINTIEAQYMIGAGEEFNDFVALLNEIIISLPLPNYSGKPTVDVASDDYDDSEVEDPKDDSEKEDVLIG